MVCLEEGVRRSNINGQNRVRAAVIVLNLLYSNAIAAMPWSLIQLE